jgi:outer membrane lipoprotein-sorting protein
LILNASGVQIHGTLTYAAPGRFRVSIPGAPVEIVDMNAGKIVLLDTMNKSATVLNLDDAPADSKRAEVDWIEKLRNVSHDAGKPLGVATINGVRAAQFSVTDEGQQILVWSDASTGEPIRIETKLVSGKNVVTMALDHLTINPQIDERQFSVNIPPGYATQSGHVSAAALSEDDLIRFFKEYVARTGSFPPSLTDYQRSVQRMITPAKHQAGSGPDASVLERLTRATRAVLFVDQLPQSADWHYNPAAKPGDQTVPLFWYRVSDQKDYHVIRADFAVLNTPTPPAIAGAETAVTQK